MTAILYEANHKASDILLVDNELAPGQKLRNEPPLTLQVGNGCEDGAIHLTRDMAIGLRNALTTWVDQQDGTTTHRLTKDQLIDILNCPGNDFKGHLCLLEGP